MIYFIKSGEFVKIGHCERDPIRRLEKLQIGNPVTLELIGVMQGSRSDERDWHWRFDKKRVRGEWFRLDRTLLRAIKPHSVDHVEWSKSRPDRMMAGVPAWKVHAYLASLGAEAAEQPHVKTGEVL
jgi:hypothetical protein